MEETPVPEPSSSVCLETRHDARIARMADAESIRLHGWALVLGASSGFGEATSLALGRAVAGRGEPGTLRVLLHPLAFGTLKLYVAEPMKDAVTQAQMDMTLDVMAHSLVYWTQEVVGRGLMGPNRPLYP